MLSTSHGFLYIHVPKTAGNSVQSVLAPYACDRIEVVGPHQDGHDRFEVRSDRFATHKHSSLADYHGEYGPTMLAKLFKFTCVRNPWERAVSFWFSPHRGPVTWDRAAFAAFVDTMPPVTAYLSRDRAGNSLAECLAGIDFVMRHETLDRDFRVACANIGIPHRELPVRNRSASRPYRDYYDQDMAAQVARRFAEEIDCLGYRF